MFDIGLGELIFIFIVFLVLFGPKSLPDLARKSAQVLNKVKSAQAEFQSQFNSLQNDIQSTIEIDKVDAGIKLKDITSKDGLKKTVKSMALNSDQIPFNTTNKADFSAEVDSADKSISSSDSPKTEENIQGKES